MDRDSILIIDDNQDFAELMAEVLEEAGFHVDLAFSGPDGVRLFREFRPTIVVCDLVMPGQDGVETIGMLRQRDPAIPILAITGGSPTHNVDRIALALRAGASTILYKPFTRDDLVGGKCIAARCGRRGRRMRRQGGIALPLRRRRSLGFASA